MSENYPPESGTNAEIDKIRLSIDYWNQIRSTDVALSFLTSGYGFTLEYEDFKNWETQNPENLHCYLGIRDLNLEFYLVDDVTDRKQNYVMGKTLVRKDFIRSLATGPSTASDTVGNMPEQEADKRIVSWILSSKSWFESQKKQRKKPGHGELLRLITLPFADLKKLMNTGDRTELIAILALKNFQTAEYNGYNVELILTRTQILTGQDQYTFSYQAYEDVSQPRPPFSVDGSYNLL